MSLYNYNIYDKPIWNGEKHIIVKLLFYIKNIKRQIPILYSAIFINKFILECNHGGQIINCKTIHSQMPI